MSEIKTLYRYRQNDQVDRVGLILQEFNVIRPTARGWWISNYGMPKWVAREGRKAFARPTKEAALTDFQARTTRRISILENQLGRARVALLASQSPDLTDHWIPEKYFFNV